jgi:hypothetical protein
MASSKADDALKKVTALEGVKAAFVFDQFFMIQARDVPANYGNDILKRIANQLYQLAMLSWEAGAVTQEFRLTYDKFSVYVRNFSTTYYLVVFMDKNLESTEFRQPINLSVLVLEKALRHAEEQVPITAVSQMALLAEQSIRQQTENDQSFAGMARKECVHFLGGLGKEIVDNGIEDEVLVLPLIAEKDMDKLIEYILPRVPHPIIRQILEQDFLDLKKKALKQL